MNDLINDPKSSYLGAFIYCSLMGLVLLSAIVLCLGTLEEFKDSHFFHHAFLTRRLAPSGPARRLVDEHHVVIRIIAKVGELNCSPRASCRLVIVVSLDHQASQRPDWGVEVVIIAVRHNFRKPCQHIVFGRRRHL